MQAVSSDMWHTVWTGDGYRVEAVKPTPDPSEQEDKNYEILLSQTREKEARAVAQLADSNYQLQLYNSKGRMYTLPLHMHKNLIAVV